MERLLWGSMRVYKDGGLGGVVVRDSFTVHLSGSHPKVARSQTNKWNDWVSPRFSGLVSTF